MTEIVFATQNPGKAREVAMMFADMDVCVKTLKEAGIEAAIVENGSTFMENARIKAETIARHTDKIVLADDSGLVIDYLNGEPGIYSARYMGEDTPYTIKNNYIIEQLKDAEGDERSARFVCAIACVFPGGRVITTEGKVEGLIAYEEKGEYGFGYDPVFYLPEKGCTTAQLKPEEKNLLSHRGRALRAMHKKLTEERIL